MLELPVTDRNQGGAMFDAGACLKAVQVIGLKQPVKVRWAGSSTGRPGRYSQRWGSHRWREGIGHLITISTYLNPEQASETLWHELAHALQMERHGVEQYRKLYRSYGKSGSAYQRNPFELEANRFETEFHALLRLTKE